MPTKAGWPNPPPGSQWIPEAEAWVQVYLTEGGGYNYLLWFRETIDADCGDSGRTPLGSFAEGRRLAISMRERQRNYESAFDEVAEEFMHFAESTACALREMQAKLNVKLNELADEALGIYPRDSIGEE